MFLSSRRLITKIISWTLALSCVIGLSPGWAFAQETQESSLGVSTGQTGNASAVEQGTTTSSGGDVTASPEDSSKNSAAASATNSTSASSVEESSQDEASASQSISTLTVQSGTTLASTQTTTDASLSGLYVVKSALSGGRVLDVSGGSTVSGAAMQLWSSNYTPAQRYRFDLGDDGYYTITNVKSGKVLDVLGAANVSGATVQQYDANGTDSQKWSIVVNSDGTYTISSKLESAGGGELVLDIGGASDVDGARVQLYASNGTNAQNWQLETIDSSVSDGWYTATSSLSSNLVLDVSGASLSPGGNVEVYSSNNTLAQRFQFKYQEDTGYYEIICGVSGLALDVAGAGTTNGTNVQQYSSNGTFAQQWALLTNTDGSLTVVNAGSGLALDICGGSSQAGANVQIWSSNGTDAQKWTLSATSLINDGVYNLTCSGDSNYVLDMTGGSCVEGSKLQIWQSNGTNAQKFAISAYGDGYYTIRNVNSGLLLGLAGGETAVGTAVDQGYAGVSDSQLWRPETAEGGIVWYSKSGMVMDVAGGVLSSGTAVRAWSYNGTVAQKFNLSATSAVFSNGIYTIASALDVTKALDIPCASTADGTLPQLFTANNSAAQKYYITSTGDGYYRITALCSNKSLDVKDYYIDEMTGSGTVQQWTTSNNDAQKWRVETTSDGYFTLYSKCGNGTSALDVKGGAASDGTLVGVYAGNSTLAQKFVLQPSSSTVSYRSMNMTLAEQAGYQLVTDSDGNLYHTYDEYYAAMNPDNASSLAVFADLRGYSGLSSDQLNQYIASTSSGQSGTLLNMGYAFVAASKQYGLNEAYVLCHAILESGWGTSPLSLGTFYDGSGFWNGNSWVEFSGYPAGIYYNYFGIAAVDNDAFNGGMKKAIINGWNSPEAAILGGAAWIASNYTYADSYPQYTLYDMRYDTARSNATMARGWHQYATSLTWANSIATLIDGCYSSAGVSATLSYLVPQYQ